MSLLRGQLVVIFHGALHEDALLDLGFVRDNGFGKGFAGRITAKVAIHLRQVLIDFESPFHLLHGRRNSYRRRL